MSWTFNSYLSPGVVTGFFVAFNTTNVGSFDNVVTLTSDSIPNKTANDTVTVLEPNYTIEKLTVNRVILLGDTAFFEIIIRNTGEVTLRNFTVYESFFDDGLVYDAWYDDTGLWSKNDDLSWTFNSYLTPGVVTGFFVAFNTTKLGSFDNVVTLTGDLIPKKTANNTIDVVKPEFSVEKITVNRTVVAGDQVIFEIIVNNYGNIALTNLTVYETEFDGLEYAGWLDYTDKWIKNSDLSWTYNSTLEAKKTADFFIVFNTTKIGNFTNVVVAGSDDSENKSANNTTVVVGADLSVVKLVSNENPNWGDEIIWTIIITNNGPARAKGVYVVDNLPYGLIYQYSNPTIGSYDSTTGIWTIGELSSMSSASLEIATLVNITNSSIFNIATVNSTTSDPNPDNNKANNTTNVNPVADLSIEKVALATDGQKVTWAIIVTNNGPDTAINTRAIDVLSNLLILLSYNASKGSFDSVAGVWTIGNMENGEIATLIIETIVNGTGTIINEARVISDTYDPNMTNNYDFDSVVVEEVPNVEPPVVPQKSSDATPATGNPLIMLLMALIALGTGALRRKK